MSHLKKYNDFIKTRIGFFSLLLVLLWLKNMFAYVVDFHLGIQNPMQLFILIINPLSVATKHWPIYQTFKSCLWYIVYHLRLIDDLAFFKRCLLP